MILRRASLRIAILPLAVGFVLLLPLATGWGNMAAPPDPATVRHGSRVGEPAGGVRDVTIERETLHIDLRPLADAKPARVDATYRLRNDGPARTLDLLFVANGLANGGGSVAVDGRPVAAAPGQPAATLPASWRAPESTPALPHADDAEARAPLPYEPRSPQTESEWESSKYRKRP